MWPAFQVIYLGTKLDYDPILVHVSLDGLDIKAPSAASSTSIHDALGVPRDWCCSLPNLKTSLVSVQDGVA